MRWLTLLFIALWCVPAAARVYVWTDPNTGTPYMAGAPPAWYRSGIDGPRVLVYDGGELVDDTAVPTPEEQARLLREQAVQAEQERLADLSRRREAGRTETEAPEAAEEGAASEVTTVEQASALFDLLMQKTVEDALRRLQTVQGDASPP